MSENDAAAARAAHARELAAKLAAGGLSKSAAKRLKRLEEHDQRKERRKTEKKRRKDARQAQPAGEDAAATAAASAAAEAAAEASAASAVWRTPEQAAAAAWAWWRSIGSPTRVLAPMVNQSELAFRLLARRHGAQLCYTPMLHAANFASDEVYRQDNFDPHPSDRPLVVQFCGDVPATLLAAARHVEARCDAVEINCGCPQGIARRGHYGAFLLDEPDLIASMVSLLASQLSATATPAIVRAVQQA